MIVLGVIDLFSNAALTVMGLIVDPGSNMSVTYLFLKNSVELLLALGL